ncbi:signal peptidase I [Planctomycetota bacterium]
MEAKKSSLKNKRHVWIAIMFSLILPGMGHIYCGKLIRGLMFTFLNMLPLPLIMGLLSVPHYHLLVEIIFFLIFTGGMVQLIAIIDSAVIAKKSQYYELKEYNRPIVYILLLFLIIGNGVGNSFYFRDKFLEAFRVPAASNYPTIVPNDRLLANKMAYKKSDPKRGDLIVFLNPEDRRINYIKRVVALPGDTVEIKDYQLYINDQKLQRRQLPDSVLDKIGIEIRGEPLKGDVYEETNDEAKYKIFLASPANPNLANFAKITVPKYHCFVLGDNLNDSRDSRHFGPIPLATIKGRADYLYWPAKDCSRFGSLKPD